MVRTQIQLTEQQARRLRAQARERGHSVAEIIRRYVEKGLAEEASDRGAVYDRAARLVGRFRDRRGARDTLEQARSVSRPGIPVNAVFADTIAKGSAAHGGC